MWFIIESKKMYKSISKLARFNLRRFFYLIGRAATATKASMARALPKFWVSRNKRSKKFGVEYWGRIRRGGPDWCRTGFR